MLPFLQLPKCGCVTHVVQKCFLRARKYVSCDFLVGRGIFEIIDILRCHTENPQEIQKLPDISKTAGFLKNCQEAKIVALEQ